MSIYVQGIKFLGSMLSLGQLYTDTNDDDDDANDTRRTNHDCIGSLACMPNEPKSSCDASAYVLGCIKVRTITFYTLKAI